MKLSIAPLAAFLILLTLAPRAGAWSGGGHQAVCQIALLELSPATRKKVNQIMSREKDNKFKPFATACTWPDSQKHTNGTIQNARRDEHFINVDRGLVSITTEDCGKAPKCLFTAIRADEDALKKSKGVNQLIALKFLGHWVGDLHQPLHISYADDLGGNDLPVSTAAGCNELHAVWDQCIPDDLRATISAGKGPTALGTKLQAEITDQQRTDWKKGDLVEWAEESYAVTRKPETKYCIIKGDQCCYESGHCEFQGAKSDETKRLMNLPHSYDDEQVEVVRERMKKAGVRLAAILEAQLQ